MRNKPELKHIHNNIYSNDATSGKSPRIGAPGLRGGSARFVTCLFE